jgi:tRNA G18 (ribose-2'-O)-methylase SpoU
MVTKFTMQELNRLSVIQYKESQKAPVVIVLDNIRSRHNIGSVFRTADAFRLQAIHLCGITATPPHRDIQKTALGATESVDWIYFPSTFESLNRLRREGYLVIAIEQTHASITLDQFTPQPGSKFALVFGNEIHGIDDPILDYSDQCIIIPQYGTKHSLNIAVAVGIVVWELFKKTSA